MQLDHSGVVLHELLTFFTSMAVVGCVWHQHAAIGYLDKWCKAICCAGSIGHDLVAGLVALLVYTNHVGGDIRALGRGCDDHLLGTCLNVLASTLTA